MKKPPRTGIENQRDEWWAEHFRPGMPIQEVYKLIEQSVALFPLTEEERERRAQGLVDVPEFLL